MKERASVSKRITSEESVLEQLRAKLHEVLQRARVEEVKLPIIGGDREESGEAGGAGGRKRRRGSNAEGDDEEEEQDGEEGGSESQKGSTRDSEVSGVFIFDGISL